VLNSAVPWPQRFTPFSVPAQAYPYGDFRNVQTAAYCRLQGYGLYGTNPCQAAGLPASKTYRDIHVPLLNYPPIWVDAYAAGGRVDDERYFMKWGQGNAILLLLALLVLCFPRNHLLLPLMLFSPPVLLCVERGNTDGVTFSLLFMGLLAARGPLSRALAIMGAAALKLFPLVALLAYARRRNGNDMALFGCGVAAGSALLAPAILNLPGMLADTPGAFEVSFGLWNFKYAPFADRYPWLPHAIQFAVLLGMVWMAFFWSRRWSSTSMDQLRAIGEQEIDLCLASLLVFLAVYIVFFNWAYRLVFVMPSVVVLSRVNAAWVRGYCVLACLVMWLPIYGFGWRYFNYAASLLALVSASLILPLWSARLAGR
jgi:hypothetical protein